MVSPHHAEVLATLSVLSAIGSFLFWKWYYRRKLYKFLKRQKIFPEWHGTDTADARLFLWFLEHRVLYATPYAKDSSNWVLGWAKKYVYSENTSDVFHKLFTILQVLHLDLWITERECREAIRDALKGTSHEELSYSDRHGEYE